MLIGDYTGTLEERMSQLRTAIADRDNLIIVGSSFGGLMAAMFACEAVQRIRRLVLLAPALAYGDLGGCCREPLDIPATIYQGSEDVVVLPEPTREAAVSLFRNLDFHLVKDDHSLAVAFPLIDWDRLLETGRR
jgi:pimeloyl-ACP methyl ester carboxylesterase